MCSHWVSLVNRALLVLSQAYPLTLHNPLLSCFCSRLSGFPLPTSSIWGVIATTVPQQQVSEQYASITVVICMEHHDLEAEPCTGIAHLSSFLPSVNCQLLCARKTGNFFYGVKNIQRIMGRLCSTYMPAMFLNVSHSIRDLWFGWKFWKRVFQFCCNKSLCCCYRVRLFKGNTVIVRTFGHICGVPGHTMLKPHYLKYKAE